MFVKFVDIFPLTSVSRETAKKPMTSTLKRTECEKHRRKISANVRV
jgi:hypothetical protein